MDDSRTTPSGSILSGTVSSAVDGSSSMPSGPGQSQESDFQGSDQEGEMSGEVAGEYQDDGSYYSKDVPREGFDGCSGYLGELGFDWLLEFRAPLMGTVVLMSAVSNVLCALAACGFSEDPSLVDSLPWVRASIGSAPYPAMNGVDVKMNINLLGRMVHDEAQDVNIWQAWSDSACDEEMCRPCNLASNATFGIIVGIMLTLFVGVAIGIVRITDTLNEPMEKLIAVLSSTIGILIGVVALIVYSEECLLMQPKSYASDIGTAEVLYTSGPGLICMIVAIALQVISLLIHLVVPALGAEGEYGDEESGLLTDPMLEDPYSNQFREEEMSMPLPVNISEQISEELSTLEEEPSTGMDSKTEPSTTTGLSSSAPSAMS